MHNRFDEAIKRLNNINNINKNIQSKSMLKDNECDDCYFNPQCRKCETCIQHCRCKE